MLPSYFGVFARGHRKLEHEDAIENTECSSLMHGSRNFNSGKDRRLSKATQQVSERGEMRIICVLGSGVTETQFQLTS